MSKDFIPYDVIRDNALKLAHKIHKDGFVPDVIYVSLRGGAYLGNVISEYFKMVRKAERPVFFAAVVARSYSDIYTRTRVMVDGWTYSPEHLRTGDKVLLIDDIFDSGRTVNHLVEIIMEHGIPREDIKVAVHDYKMREQSNMDLPIHPDYYCVKHEIPDDNEDSWLHYMSHELVGLTKAEVSQHYPDDPELQDILKQIIDKD